MTYAAKSVLLGTARPNAFDGSILLPDLDTIFPGSIFVWRPGIDGVPVHGGRVYNAAWRQLLALSGLDESHEAECHGEYVVGTDVGPDKLVEELTTTGALSRIVSQTLGGNQTRTHARASNLAKQYLLTHTTLGGASTTDTGQVWNTLVNHRFAQYMIVEPTRLYRTDSGKVGQNLGIAGIASATNFSGSPNIGGFTGISNNPAYPVSGTENTGMSTTIGSLVGNSRWPAGAAQVGVPQLWWQATRGWFGSKPASIADFEIWCGAGQTLGQTAGGYIQAAMSYKLFEWGVVDLWAGNDYGEARAFRNIIGADYSHIGGNLFRPRDRLRASMNRMFAPGGIFHGDQLVTPVAAVP